MQELKDQLQFQFKHIEILVEAIAQLKSGRTMVFPTSKEDIKNYKIATVKELFAKYSLCSLDEVLAAIEREYK
jgi:hypothetical protein